MTNNNIYELLIDKINKTQVLRNEPMSKYTTFRVGGNANLLVKARTEEEVRCVIHISKSYNIPLYILGNGSNLLVKDTGFNGIMLKIELSNIEFLENYDSVEIIVGAGYKLGKLSRRVIKKKN